MKKFNIFYFAIGLLATGMLFFLKPNGNGDISFFGFAESEETEINYNYPVVVEEILVTPGQHVNAGQELLKIYRLNPKETLIDQDFKIAEIQAEVDIWRQKSRSTIAQLSLTKNAKIDALDNEIAKIQKEIDFKKSLTEDLKSINPQPSDYKPSEDQIETIRKEKEKIAQQYDLEIEGIRKQLSIGQNPSLQQISRLKAERQFEEDSKIQQITVTAPADGIIGSISCKEEEHITAYSTILSFYEPHSSLIVGYVHEDLILQIDIGDTFEISSLKDENIKYNGVVSGMGYRIVEIPSRLRKMADVKTYGRELHVSIDKNNRFLQKEKVGMRCTSVKNDKKWLP